jgi:murein DD-endopeptidase MepM/ murein hydrolase activator NlpD
MVFSCKTGRVAWTLGQGTAQPSSKRVTSVALTALATFVFLSAGCRARSSDSAELVLRGSIAESSEVVQLDPVFLARQKQVESRFFGFDGDAGKGTESDELALGEDLDVAIEPSTVGPAFGNFGGLALQWPIQGSITSPYGMRHGRLHAGLDIKGRKGDPIYAAADGQILTSKRRNAYGKKTITKPFMRT